MIFQVNTKEDYDVIEADSMEIDEWGNLLALVDEETIAVWTKGFWYGYKTTEENVDDDNVS